jgi:hypothetical protein
MFVENLIKSRLEAVGEQKINGLCTAVVFLVKMNLDAQCKRQYGQNLKVKTLMYIRSYSLRHLCTSGHTVEAELYCTVPIIFTLV